MDMDNVQLLIVSIASSPVAHKSSNTGIREGILLITNTKIKLRTDYDSNANKGHRNLVWLSRYNGRKVYKIQHYVG